MVQNFFEEYIVYQAMALILVEEKIKGKKIPCFLGSPITVCNSFP